MYLPVSSYVETKNQITIIIDLTQHTLVNVDHHHMNARSLTSEVTTTHVVSYINYNYKKLETCQPKKKFIEHCSMSFCSYKLSKFVICIWKPYLCN